MNNFAGRTIKMPEYRVGSDEGEAISLKVEEDRVFISGQWKGRTSKSKKGNWNIAWFRKNLWDQLVKKYMGEEPDRASPAQLPIVPTRWRGASD